MKADEINKERKERSAIELLRLAGVLDEIDDDVAKLCFNLIPSDNHKLISLADLVVGVQTIKNKLRRQVADDMKKVLKNSRQKKEAER